MRKLHWGFIVSLICLFSVVFLYKIIKAQDDASFSSSNESKITDSDEDAVYPDDPPQPPVEKYLIDELAKLSKYGPVTDEVPDYAVDSKDSPSVPAMYSTGEIRVKMLPGYVLEKKISLLRCLKRAENKTPTRFYIWITIFRK